VGQPDRAEAVAAYLEEVRTRTAEAQNARPAHSLTQVKMRNSAADVPRLLGAVEAALAALVGWEQRAAKHNEPPNAALPPDAALIRAVVAQVLTEVSEELRPAITTALLREVPGA
jgi:hypothetical protein